MSKIDFSKLSSTQLLLFLLPVVVVFFIFVLYPKTEKKIKEQDQSAIINPDVKQEKELLKKSQEYKKAINEAEEQKRSEKRKAKKNFFLLVNETPSVDTSINKVSDDTSKKEKNIDDFFPGTGKKKNIKKKKQGHKKYSNRKKKKVDERIVAIKKVTEEKTEKTPIKNKTYNSFYYHQEPKKTNEKKLSQQNDNLFLGVLEKSLKLTDGQEISFLLRKEFMYQTIKFKKFSLLIGTVEFMGNRINVNINTIKNSNGEIYAINMIGYNENYQKGIFFKGYADQQIKEAQDNSIDNATSSNAFGYVNSGVANAGANMVKETAKSFKKPVSVYIKKGYKMYFKLNDNE